MNKILCFFVTLLFFFCLSLRSEEFSNITNQPQSFGDVICGPKCVQQVLRHYRQDEDIVNLIYEMQYPELQKGSGLSNVSAALEKRGIYTFAMRINPSARIVWRYPVIVHYLPPAEGALGHYVVWLPQSHENDVYVWDGKNGIQKLDERQWSKKRSGILLLTSPTEIKNPGEALQWSGCDFWLSIFAWIFFLCSAAWTVKVFRWHGSF